MTALMFVDGEMTGFSPRKHEIIELAAAVEIDNVTQCEFVLRFRPEKWDTISPKALEKNGWTVERLKRLPDRVRQENMFSKIMDWYSMNGHRKFTIIEHSKNGNFDIEFLKSLFREYAKLCVDARRGAFCSFFNNKPINTRDLVKRRFPKEKHLTLKDCARLLKIPFDEEQHHGARYDMEIMREIYHRCTGRRK